MLHWAHPSPNPKLRLDRFSRFCTAHGRESLYFTTSRFFPLKLAHSNDVIWSPPSNTSYSFLTRFCTELRLSTCIKELWWWWWWWYVCGLHPPHARIVPNDDAHITVLPIYWHCHSELLRVSLLKLHVVVHEKVTTIFHRYASRTKLSSSVFTVLPTAAN